MNPMSEPALIVEDARNHLPHRVPFLFVDRAEIGADAKSARARHTFAADEPYFAGHFPGDPIVPGVILIEFVAQTANVLLSHRAGRMIQGYLVGVDEAKFNTSVRPNQTVTAHVEFAREISAGSGPSAGNIIAFKATAYIEQRRCMRATVQIYQQN